MAIFPNIEGFDDIPTLHYNYADFVLKTLVKNIFAQEEVEIGVGTGSDAGTSRISFYGSTDNLELHLLFANHTFRIRVLEHGDSNNTGQFIYNLTDNEMEEFIPEQIRGEMRDVAFEREPKTILVKNIMLDSSET